MRIESTLDRLTAKVDLMQGILKHTRLEMRSWMGLIVAIALGLLWKI